MNTKIETYTAKSLSGKTFNIEGPLEEAEKYIRFTNRLFTDYVVELIDSSGLVVAKF